MVLVLKIVGWMGMILSGSNATIKIFGEGKMLLLYGISSRNLNMNLLMAAFCLILLALAAILKELRVSNKGADE